MRAASIKLLFLLLLILSTQVNLFGQDRTGKIVNNLNDVIKPVETLKPDSSFSDLSFLKNTLKDRDIIALGEGTHGTKEFYTYKDRLIRFLVTQLGYKAIGFEADFSATKHLDDFINNKTERLELIPGGGFPLTKETRQLFTWLKSYNQLQLEADKVHVYGLEARGFNNISIQILNALPNLSETVKETLSKNVETDYARLTKTNAAALLGILPALYNEAAKSPENAGTNKLYVTLLDQAVNNYLKNNPGDRDQSMAENTSWILENTTAKKLIIWAHNGHVAKSSTFRNKSAGNHLYDKYGAKYFVIATDFNKGEVSVLVKKDKQWKRQPVYYPDVTSSNSYEYYFKQCKFQNFFIDISSLDEKDSLYGFFRKTLAMRLIGSDQSTTDIKLSILKNFDLIVFFNSTSALY